MMKSLFACSVEHFKTYKYQIRDELHMQHNIFCAWWVFHRIDTVAIAQYHISNTEYDIAQLKV